MARTTLIFILFTMKAFAFQITVTELDLRPGFSYSYLLTNPLSSGPYINVDCQSFYHKFNVYDKSDLIYEEYITANECENIMQTTYTCIQETGQRCFEVDNIFSSACEC